MSSHVQYVHGNPDPVHCKFCDKSFGSIVTLNQHTFEKHTRYHGTGNATEESSVLETSPHCEKMLHSLGTNTPQRSTSSSQSSPSSVSSDVDLNTCIGQLDGNDSIDDIDCIPQIDGLDDISVVEISSPRTVEAAYSLNEERQAEKICRDATVDDINIVVNNNDTNVNINCSTGFYMIVVRPVLSGISEGSVTQHPPIQVTCTEYVVKTDKNGVHEVAKVSFDLKGSDLSSIGSVCVHFRHTTRLVQVQGSAKMPNKTTAAIWFTEYVLNERFQRLAKKKQFDIAAFNNGVLEMSRNHHNSLNIPKFCFHCDKQFSSNSKPTQCPTCHKHVHKACWRPHSSCCGRLDQAPTPAPHTGRQAKRLRSDEPESVQPGSSQSVSSSTSAILPFMSSLTTSLINSGVSTFTGSRTSITFVPNIQQIVPSSSAQVSTNTISTVATSNTSHPISSIVCTVSTGSSTSLANSSSTLSSRTNTASSSYPGTTPYTAFTTIIPSLPCVTTAGMTQNITGPNRTKSGAKKKQIPETAESVQIDYLTTELNYTHSKIVSQDNTIKDLEFKVKILEEKLRLSEEKLNSDMHRKYFGDSGVGQCSSCVHSTCHSRPSPSPPPLCCHSSAPSQPTCAARPNLRHDENHSILTHTISELKKTVEGLKNDILNLQTMISSKPQPSSTSKTVSPPDLHQHSQHDHDHDLSNRQTVVEAEIHQTDIEDNIEVENISIEEFVPEIEVQGPVSLQHHADHLN